MPDLIPTALYALLTALAAMVIASIATSVRLLPEVIDLSIIPTTAGLGSLALTSYGAERSTTSPSAAACAGPAIRARCD
jgi:hypothetical protein